MKTLARFLEILIPVVLCSIGAFAWGTTYGAKTVVSDVQKVTSQGRVVTAIEVVDPGVNYKFEITHRPKPFYFPDDNKAVGKSQ